METVSAQKDFKTAVREKQLEAITKKLGASLADLGQAIQKARETGLTPGVEVYKMPFDIECTALAAQDGFKAILETCRENDLYLELSRDRYSMPYIRIDYDPKTSFSQSGIHDHVEKYEMLFVAPAAETNKSKKNFFQKLLKT